MCAHDAFEIMVGFGEKSAKPFLAINSTGEIQFMEDGEFFFVMEDGDVVVCGRIELHL